ncbi:MAG TPA: hypothetical protein VM866_12265 [Pyrinomonadaceae bacterium]|jgi:hypothetical protein|nr:hypothetical protein [Pyrinomonadaceae bacterium]
MQNLIKVEIAGRDKFWANAVLVEWRHQFPDRELSLGSDGFYAVEKEWIADLERVAGGCFAKVVIAPEIPSRLSWLRRMIKDGGR